MAGKKKDTEYKGDYFYYLAYGSNINMEQMSQRCPKAYPVGKALLEGYQLSFKGSQSGNYLTIEKRKGSRVPVVVWKVHKRDIVNLNIYEGYPTFYGIRRFKKLEVQTFLDDIYDMDCFAYIMVSNRDYGMPSVSYVKCVSDGYDRFEIDQRFLDEALEYTRSQMDGSLYTTRSN